jgi:UDP-N-acetylglucosamine transferase subunit ALG13
MVWLASMAQKMNHRLISRFTKCWVPDTPDHQLSGELSHSNTIGHRFIGPLSRMKPGSTSFPSIRFLALISGPEPHRSIFEERVVRQLKASGSTYRVVRGLPSATEQTSEYVYNHLQSEELQKLIESCEIIICRSGYSTVMDLAVLKKKAIFVPTTGQTEQIYLAKMFDDKRIAPTMSQKTFDLDTMVRSLKDYSGFAGIEENNLLFRALRKFLQ